jgi:anti-sigma regulatory factor (Ser/Thr protein kinase)
VDIRWTQDGSIRVLVPDCVTTADDLAALHDAVLVALADADGVVCDLTACELDAPAAELADAVTGAAARAGDWPGAVLTVVAPQDDLRSQLTDHLLTRPHPGCLVVAAAPPEAPGDPVPVPPRGVRAARRMLEPVLRAPALARTFLREILAGWPTAGHKDDALVVVDELVANAVLHAGTDIELRFALQDDRLGIAVADRAPFRPSMGRPGDVAESGRGLLLVDALARSWHVLPRSGGGKVIRAVLVASAAPAVNR